MHESGRIVVVLTITEAAALVGPGPRTAALQGLAKIRTALNGALAAPVAPTPVVKHSGQFDELSISSIPAPPLRAKHYRPRDRPPLVVRPAEPKFRMAKAVHPRPIPAPDVDDYVPWRDEAHGIYT
jgi:hypothetical protein